MARKLDFDEKELLNKAVDLFWHKGYYATSAQDLVDGLGLSRSSIYNTYTDKKTLFTKALQQYQAQNTNAVLTLLTNAGDAEEVITKLLWAVVRESREDELAKGCFMVNTAVELSNHDKDVALIVSQNQQSVEDALTKIMEKGQRDGQFKTLQHPKSMAQFIFSTISGLRVSARSGAGEEVLSGIVRVALDALKN
jgi:TetR/AcrR family transcriptional repressor of nem operon